MHEWTPLRKRKRSLHRPFSTPGRLGRGCAFSPAYHRIHAVRPGGRTGLGGVRLPHSTPRQDSARHRVNRRYSIGRGWSHCPLHRWATLGGGCALTRVQGVCTNLGTTAHESCYGDSTRRPNRGCLSLTGARDSLASASTPTKKERRAPAERRPPGRLQGNKKPPFRAAVFEEAPGRQGHGKRCSNPTVLVFGPMRKRFFRRRASARQHTGVRRGGGRTPMPCRHYKQ